MLTLRIIRDGIDRWYNYMYPNKNKPNHFVPVVDRNSIHSSSNMSDTNDEEPLNSPDFAHQRPSNRWRPHMRGK